MFDCVLFNILKIWVIIYNSYTCVYVCVCILIYLGHEFRQCRETIFVIITARQGVIRLLLEIHKIFCVSRQMKNRFQRRNKLARQIVCYSGFIFYENGNTLLCQKETIDVKRLINKLYCLKLSRQTKFPHFQIFWSKSSPRQNLRRFGFFI